MKNPREEFKKVEVKERVIDLRQYFLYLWENAIVVVLVVALFTFGMMGVSYKKQKKEISTLTEAEVASLDAIMTQNHDAYYRLNDVTAYTDAELPAGTYNSSAKLYVDFNFSNIEGGDNVDYSNMVIRLQQDVMLLLVSNDSLNDVIEKLDLTSYRDMKDLTASDLSWMINKNFMGANVMQLAVTDVDPDRAKLIADAIIAELQERSKNFASVDSVEIIDAPSKPIKGIKTENDELEVKKSISKKKLLKYGIVGCAGGVAFIAVVFLLIFIFFDAVRNAIDVSFADMELFGVISKRSSKEEYKRLAYNISLVDSCKVLTVVPTDKYSENDTLVKSVQEELNTIGKKVKVISGEDVSAETIENIVESSREKNDLTIILVKNIKQHADATIAAINSDAIIINARYGKTRMKDLIFAKAQIDKTGVKLLGTVIDR